MKVEFELTLDELTGEPKIVFKHHDRISALEHRLLNIFIHKAKERGLVLTNPNGMLEAGTDNSWEQYEIKPTPQKSQKLVIS